MAHKLFLSIFFWSLLQITAVGQGFNSSILFGINAAQIDGDQLVGFHKPGLNAGLRVSYPLKPKTDLGIELLFSQRGSRTPLGTSDVKFINLNYLAIPIFANFKDLWIEEDKAYKVRAEGGFTLGYLFSLNSNLFDNDVIDQFNKFDFGIHLGASYNIYSKLALTARYNRSFLNLYTDPTNPQAQGWVSYFWTLRLEYALL